MKILWLTWKDRSHPLAGGAETVSGEIMDRLVRDGHELKVITARYPNSEYQETKNEIKFYRVGNKYTVYLEAKKLYKKELTDWADVVIDEMNTIPFGSGFYNKSKNILLCYQLAREVWFYQMVFPISLFGYGFEPFMLKGLSKKYSVAITESQSTKKDIARYGFNNIKIFKIGMELKPLTSLNDEKTGSQILSLGSIRPMKRTLHAVMAFEAARDIDTTLNMTIAGDDSGKYAEKVKLYISKSRHSDAITVLGRVSKDQKLKLMQKSDIILVTSVKEGWGLIVTEANSQGTPAIAYDVDGLRDSVKDNITGLLAPDGNYTAMGNKIIELLSDKERYDKFRSNAWEWSKDFTFDNSYKDFLKIILNL